VATLQRSGRLLVYALFAAACAAVLLNTDRLIAVLSILDHLVVWGAFLGLYAVALILAGPMSRGLWTGYVYLGVLAAYLTTGLAPALLLVLLGGTVAIGYKIRFSRHSRLREASWGEIALEFMGRVATPTAKSLPVSSREMMGRRAPRAVATMTIVNTAEALVATRPINSRAISPQEASRRRE